MISAVARRSAANLFSKKVSLLLPLHFSSTTSEADLWKRSENTESIMSFLKEKGFSDPQLERVLKIYKQLNRANLEKAVKPKILMFHEFGFSESETAEIISRQPKILGCSATNRLHPSLSILKRLFASHAEVVTTLRRTGWYWFLPSDLTKTLSPNIEFLKNLGIPMESILRLLTLAPSLFAMKPKLLRKGVEKLESLGVDLSSKMSIYSLWAVVSLSDEHWELKLQAFRDLGFTESEIIGALTKAPMVFLRSSENIKEKAKFILATGKYTISCIKKSPTSLSYSTEKRVQPRLEVLEILEEKKLIRKWPTLGCLCSYTDQQFWKRYIAPFPEVFSTFPSSGGKKSALEIA